MNQVKFLCLVIAMLCTMPCFGKRLSKRGKWPKHHRSVVIDAPIEFSIEENSGMLFINFNDDLGLVYVTVADENGNVVYHEPISSIENHFLSISLKGLCNEGTVSVTDGVNSIFCDFFIQ